MFRASEYTSAPYKKADWTTVITGQCLHSLEPLTLDISLLSLVHSFFGCIWHTRNKDVKKKKDENKDLKPSNILIEPGSEKQETRVGKERPPW